MTRRAALLTLLLCGAAHAQGVPKFRDARVGWIGAPFVNRPLGIAGLDASGTASATSVIATNATAVRSLGDHFGDVVQVRDFGAKCDGHNDDSASFLLAISKGAASGKAVIFSGVCVINTAISVNVSQAAGLSIYGNGGEIVLNGNDFLHITKSGSAGYRTHIFGFRVNNASPSQTGTVFTVDGTQNGVGSSQNDRFEDLDIYNTGTAFNLIATSNAIVKNINAQICCSTSSYFVKLSGPTINGSTVYSANTLIQSSYVVGGQLLDISGGVQGFTVRDTRHLEGRTGWSIYEHDPVNFEGGGIFGSYLEAKLGGIYLPDAHGIQVIGNSFDTTSVTGSSWSAVVLGNPNGTSEAVTNNQIIGNSAFANTASSDIYQYVGGQAVISNNICSGVSSNAASCIHITTANGGESAAAYISLVNNISWHSGGFIVDGSSSGKVIARGNTYSSASGEKTFSQGGSEAMNTLLLTGGLTSQGPVQITDTSGNGAELQWDGSELQTIPNIGTGNGNFKVNGTLSATVNLTAPKATISGTVSVQGFDDTWRATAASWGSNRTTATYSQIYVANSGFAISDRVYCSDCRNAGQAAGAGTGRWIFLDSKSTWRTDDGAVATN